MASVSISNFAKFVFIAVLVLISNCSAAGNYQVSVYSNLIYTPAEGEVSGLEICLFQSPDGLQVTWRLGNGRMERALLLDVMEVEGRRFVDVPDVIDGAGRWELVISKRNITATGPKQQKFRLNRVGRNRIGLDYGWK
jgi:hypothetical protein